MESNNESPETSSKPSEAKGAVLRDWVLAPECPDDFVTFFDRVRELGLAILDNGTWVDLQSQSIIRTNHLRCMLRREYLAIWPDRTGKLANHAADVFTAEVLRGVRAHLKSGASTGKRITLEISDDYLPN
jgi:hypothetical protein